MKFILAAFENKIKEHRKYSGCHFLGKEKGSLILKLPHGLESLSCQRPWSQSPAA